MEAPPPRPSPASGRGGRHTFAISRRITPELFQKILRPEIQEGAGNAGCLLHPRSRVQCARESAHTSIQVQREQPGIPCAVVLRLIPCSPRRRIRFASVTGGLKVLAKPGWISQNLRRLDTSNGCQDHTALPSASAPFVGARPSLTGLNPPCENLLARPALCGHRSPHPTSVTIAIRPSCGRGMAGVVRLIWGEREADYFSREGWTGFK